MSENISAELKLYVKEEKDKVLSELRDVLEKAESRRFKLLTVFGTIFSIFIAILSWFMAQGSVSSAISSKLTDKGFIELKNQSRNIYGEILNFHKESRRKYNQIEGIVTTLREEGIVIPTGTILPFEGSMEDAENLFDKGWIICDGRDINHPLISEKLKNKKTPDLKDKFLRGGTESGKEGGKSVQTTNVKGEHKHSREEINPMNTPYSGNRWFGDDGGDNTFRNAPDGKHSHDVSVIPPYYSVIYLIYVL